MDYPMQTKNPVIAGMATEYLRICCVFSFGIFCFSLYEKVLQATGKSMYSTIAQITGAVINIVLDPILIYGLFGGPALGVSGAAYATIVGQIASALCGLVFHLRVNKEVKNKLQYMKPSGNIIKAIYSIGFPAIIAQALMSVMTYLLNVIFGKVGENVVTAYGLYYKIQQFILFAAFGLRDAITPIVSFNHGMKNQKRVQDGIKYGMVYTLIIMFVGFVGLEILAKPFAGVFGLSGETKDLCIRAMQVISICRQFLFVIPVAYVFSKLVISQNVGTWILWTAFPIAEILSVIVAIILFKKVYKRI